MSQTIKKMPGTEEFRAMLKKCKLKATKQRLAVHAAMMQLGHASADMVTEVISRQGSTRVTVASVYNILAQLALLGIYSHRLSAGGKMFFDVNNYNHIHLYDIRNHTYRDVLDEDILEYVEERLARRRFRGYKVEGVDIQIICHPTRTRA